jgi:diadenosine tetraphosphate (Ap4A) HIT family hydrolase
MTGHIPPGSSACAICADNRAADEGADPWFVARLRTGYVRLAPTQYYSGSTFFVAKQCVAELHHLDQRSRDEHLAEMADVAQAVFTTFRPRKLNYEALGNGVPHLHWWLTPRHEDDRNPRGPIWENLDFLRVLWTRGMQPEATERDALRKRLLESLESMGLHLEQIFART